MCPILSFNLISHFVTASPTRGEAIWRPLLKAFSSEEKVPVKERMNGSLREGAPRSGEGACVVTLKRRSDVGTQSPSVTRYARDTFLALRCSVHVGSLC